MFVDLTTGINGEDIDHLRFPIHREQNAPAANAGLSDSGPLGEGRGQARIERVNSKFPKPSANTLFGRPIKAIKNLLGFVSDADSKVHRPRSRLYSARGFTRPAARSARPRSREASASAPSGGPPSSAASRRSWRRRPFGLGRIRSADRANVSGRKRPIDRLSIRGFRFKRPLVPTTLAVDARKSHRPGQSHDYP